MSQETFNPLTANRFGFEKKSGPWIGASTHTQHWYYQCLRKVRKKTMGSTSLHDCTYTHRQTYIMTSLCLKTQREKDSERGRTIHPMLNTKAENQENQSQKHFLTEMLTKDVHQKHQGSPTPSTLDWIYSYNPLYTDGTPSMNVLMYPQDRAKQIKSIGVHYCIMMVSSCDCNDSMNR